MPFLGRLPVDTELVDLLDSPNAELPTDGENPAVAEPTTFPLLAKYKRTPSSVLFVPIVQAIKGSIDSGVDQLLSRPPVQVETATSLATAGEGS